MKSLSLETMQKPSKFPSFPNYEKYIADQKYAEIADVLDRPSADAARMAVNRAVIRLASSAVSKTWGASARAF